VRFSRLVLRDFPGLLHPDFPAWSIVIFPAWSIVIFQPGPSSFFPAWSGNSRFLTACREPIWV
jgi:hypothetical protein